MQTRFYAASIVILVVGVASGLLIYVTADENSINPAIEQMLDSKAYVRQLQVFGGKAAVLFDQFSRWFAGLWQGKSLGATIAWLSVFASLGVFLVARRLDDRD